MTPYFSCSGCGFKGLCGQFRTLLLISANFIIFSKVIDSRHLERLSAPDKRLIMVIGASDSGKTTLVWHLSRLLMEHYKTAIVDLDMGQSRIGPPTTVGWAMMETYVEHWLDIKEKDFYFTGTVTPFGSLLPAITGAMLITEKASNFAEKVIIDTTGLISEPTGRVLKHYKMDIINPDIILAVSSGNELSHILDPLRFNAKPEIIMIKPPTGVKIKTPIKRREYRFEKMLDYLRESAVKVIETRKIGVRFTRHPLQFNDDLRNRIVSLRDRSNRDIALGVIRSIGSKEIKILTPLKDVEDISSIVIGRTAIDMEGRSLRDL